MSQYGLFGCRCTSHFTGAICETPVTTPQPTTTSATITTTPCPCQNGGVCGVSQYGLPYCSCPSGFTGTICQHNLPTTYSPTTTQPYTVQPSNGEQCTDSSGQKYNDGDMWALTNCISYYCVGGHITAYNTCNDEDTATDSTGDPPAPCNVPTGQSSIQHGQFYHFNHCLKYLCLSGTLTLYNNCKYDDLENTCEWNSWYVHNYYQWTIGGCNKHVCKNGVVTIENVCTTQYTTQPPTTVSTVRCVDQNGQTYPHGAVWSKGECEGFSCYMGIIREFNKCNHQQQHSSPYSVQNQYDNQAQQQPHQYDARSCLFDGQRYTHGQQWYKAQCESYVCTAGSVTYFNHCNIPASAPSTTLAPQLQHCIDVLNRVYYHGQIWSKDECTNYYCDNGIVKTQNICHNGSPGSENKSCWMCDAENWDACYQTGQSVTCGGSDVCFLEIRSRAGVLSRVCQGCQQVDACEAKKTQNAQQCRLYAVSSGESVCHDCCEGLKLALVFSSLTILPRWQLSECYKPTAYTNDWTCYSTS